LIFDDGERTVLPILIKYSIKISGTLYFNHIHKIIIQLSFLNSYVIFPAAGLDIKAVRNFVAAFNIEVKKKLINPGYRGMNAGDWEQLIEKARAWFYTTHPKDIK
jgi:hypothetical protein